LPRAQSTRCARSRASPRRRAKPREAHRRDQRRHRRPSRTVRGPVRLVQGWASIRPSASVTSRSPTASSAAPSAHCNSLALSEPSSTARTKTRVPPSPSSSMQNSRRHPARLCSTLVYLVRYRVRRGPCLNPSRQVRATMRAGAAARSRATGSLRTALQHSSRPSACRRRDGRLLGILTARHAAGTWTVLTASPWIQARKASTGGRLPCRAG